MFDLENVLFIFSDNLSSAWKLTELNFYKIYYPNVNKYEFLNYIHF